MASIFLETKSLDSSPNKKGSQNPERGLKNTAFAGDFYKD